MKILLSVDIEGVSGVVSPEQTRVGHAEYEKARQWMLQETNAAIEGAFEGGADEVLVNDSHAMYRNLMASELDDRALLITGKPRQLGMLAGIDKGVDAVALIGHHSMAGGYGVLSHTINSSAFAQILVNDIAVGEPALYGALAGEFGVPVIFGSGDQYLAQENTHFFPEVVWVQTKEALGQYCAQSLSLVQSMQAIRQGMCKAVKKLRNECTKFKRFSLGEKLSCRIYTQTVAHADLFCLLPGTAREQANVLSFAALSCHDLVRILNVFSAMAVSLK